MAESRYDLHELGAVGIDRATSTARRLPSPALARSVFRLRSPSPQEIAAVARANASEPYSYTRVGASAGRLPDGFDADRSAVVVGHGPVAFHRASDALRAFAVFELPWVERAPAPSPPRPGQVLAFATRQLGVWSIHACRIVYVVEPEEGAVVRYGFAIGTLRTHALSGEARFLVEWDRGTDEVRFGITRFARPAHPFVWMLAPVCAALQRRFTREGLEALRRAVREG